MNTRNQDRKKKIIAKNKQSQVQEEIIDIKEIKEIKIPKNKKKREIKKRRNIVLQTLLLQIKKDKKERTIKMN